MAAHAEGGECKEAKLYILRDEIYSYLAVWAAVSVSTDFDALAPCRLRALDMSWRKRVLGSL